MKPIVISGTTPAPSTMSAVPTSVVQTGSLDSDSVALTKGSSPSPSPASDAAKKIQVERPLRRSLSVPNGTFEILQKAQADADARAVKARRLAESDLGRSSIENSPKLKLVSPAVSRATSLTSDSSSGSNPNSLPTHLPRKSSAPQSSVNVENLNSASSKKADDKNTVLPIYRHAIPLPTNTEFASADAAVELLGPNWLDAERGLLSTFVKREPYVERLIKYFEPQMRGVAMKTREWDPASTRVFFANELARRFYMSEPVELQRWMGNVLGSASLISRDLARQIMLGWLELLKLPKSASKATSAAFAPNKVVAMSFLLNEDHVLRDDKQDVTSDNIRLYQVGFPMLEHIVRAEDGPFAKGRCIGRLFEQIRAVDNISLYGQYVRRLEAFAPAMAKMPGYPIDSTFNRFVLQEKQTLQAKEREKLQEKAAYKRADRRQKFHKAMDDYYAHFRPFSKPDHQMVTASRNHLISIIREVVAKGDGEGVGVILAAQLQQAQFECSDRQIFAVCDVFSEAIFGCGSRAPVVFMDKVAEIIKVSYTDVNHQQRIAILVGILKYAHNVTPQVKMLPSELFHLLEARSRLYSQALPALMAILWYARNENGGENLTLNRIVEGVVLSQNLALMQAFYGRIVKEAPEWAKATLDNSTKDLLTIALDLEAARQKLDGSKLAQNAAKLAQRCTASVSGNSKSDSSSQNDRPTEWYILRNHLVFGLFDDGKDTNPDKRAADIGAVTFHLLQGAHRAAGPALVEDLVAGVYSLQVGDSDRVPATKNLASFEAAVRKVLPSWNPPAKSNA